MEFDKVLEEVDVNQLSGKKENLSKQLEKISQQEQLETQKAIDAIRQKYTGQKNMIAKQIQDIDQSVTQTATNLQQQQKQDQQVKQNVPAQAPAQPAPVATKTPAPAVKPGIVPVSPA